MILMCTCLASELQKDAEANIGRLEKLFKILKKLYISSDVDDAGLQKVCEGMKQIDACEETINTWAIKFGFRADKTKRNCENNKRNEKDKKGLEKP